MEDKFYGTDHDAGVSRRNNGLRKPGLALVGFIYTMAVILLVFVGSRFQHNEFYSGILVTEFILIALPPVAMLAIYRYDIRNVLRLNRPGRMNILLIFLAMVFAMPVVSVLNLINLILLKNIFGKVDIGQIPIASDARGLLLNLLVIAGSAGICEEILFRGTIMRGLERFGAVKAILITAFLFGLMHVDFQRLLGTFLLGALIGFFVYRTNSIYSGVFAHFINNGLAVVLGYLAAKMPKPSNAADKALENGVSGLDFSSITNLPLAQLIISMVFLGAAVVFCTIMLILILNALVKRTERQVEEIGPAIGKNRLIGLTAFIPGIAVVAFIYFAQGLKLGGIKLEVIRNIIHAMGLR